MEDCLFCKIAAGEIPGAKVYEDDKFFAFRDIHPQAPTHILIIPKAHMANVQECANDPALLGELFALAAKLAQSEGLTKGFRLVTNCGPDGAQSVNHFHVHLLGGCQLSGQMA